ncbi:MAG: hypothetical protein ACE5DX_01335, partial [Candidatus Dojkabacteria bacterium]
MDQLWSPVLRPISVTGGLEVIGVRPLKNTSDVALRVSFIKTTGLVTVDDPFREHDGTRYSREVLKTTFIMALASASPDAIECAFKQAQVNEPYAIERRIWMQRLAPDGVGIKVVMPEAIAEIYKDY